MPKHKNDFEPEFNIISANKLEKFKNEFVKYLSNTLDSFTHKEDKEIELTKKGALVLAHHLFVEVARVPNLDKNARRLLFSESITDSLNGHKSSNKVTCQSLKWLAEKSDGIYDLIHDKKVRDKMADFTSTRTKEESTESKKKNRKGYLDLHDDENYLPRNAVRAAITKNFVGRKAYRPYVKGKAKNMLNGIRSLNQLIAQSPEVIPDLDLTVLDVYSENELKKLGMLSVCLKKPSMKVIIKNENKFDEKKNNTNDLILDVVDKKCDENNAPQPLPEEEDKDDIIDVVDDNDDVPELVDDKEDSNETGNDTDDISETDNNKEKESKLPDDRNLRLREEIIKEFEYLKESVTSKFKEMDEKNKLVENKLYGLENDQKQLHSSLLDTQKLVSDIRKSDIKSLDDKVEKLSEQVAELSKKLSSLERDNSSNIDKKDVDNIKKKLLSLDELIRSHDLKFDEHESRISKIGEDVADISRILISKVEDTMESLIEKINISIDERFSCLEKSLKSDLKKYKNTPAKEELESNVTSDKKQKLDNVSTKSLESLEDKITRPVKSDDKLPDKSDSLETESTKTTKPDNNKGIVNKPGKISYGVKNKQNTGMHPVTLIVRT